MAAIAEKPKVKKYVYLTWTEQRIWVVHPTQGGGTLSTKLMQADGKLTPEEVKEHLKKQEQFNIIPGTQQYDAHAWALVAGHPDVLAALEDGRLKLETNADFGLEGDKNAPADQFPEDLDKLSTGPAKSLAENCMELNVLKRWLNAENKGKGRATIVEILESQIKAVEDIEAKIKAEKE